MKAKDIIDIIEHIAPLSLQENYDNSGIQIGHPTQEVTGILLCLDITEAVIEEAIQLNCNLIIAHHPICFRPFKSLTAKNYIERCIMQACKHNIMLYAAHTNLDNAPQGINQYLAKQLHLQNCQILSPLDNHLVKLVTFTPLSHADNLRQALFHAGAGTIGNYDCTSYNTKGIGTFKANTIANPFCGTIGELHQEEEIRIEIILPRHKKHDVIRALITNHPYEEPAYDIYPLENTWAQAGSGIVGTLPEPLPEEDFLYLLKDTFKLHTIQHSPLRGKPITEVAICSGSGAFLIKKAIAYGADILITGEAKYNDFFDVEKKLLLATIGHYESEICAKEIFFAAISKKYPNFAIYKAGTDTSPVNYL